RRRPSATATASESCGPAAFRSPASRALPPRCRIALLVAALVLVLVYPARHPFQHSGRRDIGELLHPGLDVAGRDHFVAPVSEARWRLVAELTEVDEQAPGGIAERESGEVVDRLLVVVHLHLFRLGRPLESHDLAPRIVDERVERVLEQLHRRSPSTI